MTLQQLRLLFFQLADTVWMEQHHVWSVRSKHGQYAKDSVIRDPQCAGREVSKAVNTSEEYPSPSDSCQCTKSASVNIAAGAGFKDTFNKKFKCTQTVCRCLGNFVVLSSIFLHYTNMDLIYKEFHQHWVKRYLFEFPACADLCVWEPGSVSLRLINSDAGWQFSCSSDIFYHTCAGDWRTFKLVTFLLWKYPFSLMAAKQVCLSQYVMTVLKQLVWLYCGIWNNNRLNWGQTRWFSSFKTTWLFVVLMQVTVKWTYFGKNTFPQNGEWL